MDTIINEKRVTLIGSREMTQRLGISYSNLMKRVRNKTLPYAKSRGKLVFPLSYLEGLEQEAYDNFARGKK